MKHATSLDQDHRLGSAGMVSTSALSLHLVQHHGVPVRVRTQGELGRLHLLAHTCEAYPELLGNKEAVAEYLLWMSRRINADSHA